MADHGRAKIDMLPGARRQLGKWSKTNVPHKGWTCNDDPEILDDPAICEMCETAEIRFAHHVTHPNYPRALAVGCICAERMTEDYVNPRERENYVKSRRRRKDNWLARKWKAGRNGIEYIRVDGFVVSVWEQDDGYWAAKVTEKENKENSRKSREKYETPDQVKLAAFNVLEQLRKRRSVPASSGPGTP